MIRQLLRCKRGTAAVEAAIFAPIFLLLTLGITDLGAGMLVRMQVNAATQAGAIYGIVHSGTGNTCATMTAACRSAIKAAITDATGNESFCSTYTCTPQINTCDDGSSAQCIVVTATYPYTSILPDAIYSWAQSTNVTSTSTIRMMM